MGIWTKFDKQMEKSEIAFLMNPTELAKEWKRSFELFCSAWENEKQKRYPNKITLAQLEDDTDWKHEIFQWFEDCTDELSMVNEFEYVLKIFHYMKKEFLWDDFDAECGVSIVECLRGLGNIAEAEEYCKKMLKDHPGNYYAIAALSRVYMDNSQYNDVEVLLSETGELERNCDEDNEILFITAETLYEKTKQKKKLKEIQKKLKEYEDSIEDDFGFDDDEDEWELPFS